MKGGKGASGVKGSKKNGSSTSGTATVTATATSRLDV